MIRFKEYELYLRENEIAPKTIKNYMNTLNHFDGFCKENDIKKLDKSAVLKYKDFIKHGYPVYEKITKTGRKIPAKKYTVATYNQKVGALNAYFNWVGANELVLIKQRQQLSAHKEFVSYKEYQRLLVHADEETQLLMLIIMNTGMRIAEVKMVKKKHLYQRSFDVDNKATIRPIAINQKLKKRLKVFSLDMDDSQSLFQLHESTYSRRLKKVAGLAKVKLDRVHPHAFRHLFAVTFLKNGGNPLTLQQILGHKDSKTTAIYAAMSRDDQIDIYNEIEYF